MNLLCFRVEEKLRRIRHYSIATRVYYRATFYRASLDAEGRPVYLAKGSTRWDRSRYVVVDTAYTKCMKAGNHPSPSFPGYCRVEDAEDGKPITERDVLKFVPDMTHPMAALDRLRDLLEGEE